MRRRPLRSTPFPYTTLFRSLTRPRGLIGDREGDVDASGTGLGIFAAACGNHHKLATVYFIAGRSCVSGEGKRCFPEELAGGVVVGADFFVAVGRADEEKACGRDAKSCLVLC